MARFGAAYPHHTPLTTAGKIGYHLYGYPFIGGYLRSLYFKRAIGGKTYTAILDAGCGSGEYSIYLSQRYPLATVTGIDIDTTAIKENRRITTLLDLKNVQFNTTSVHDIQEKNHYDLIVSVDVLEHIESNDKVLQRFFTALRPGGELFVHLPVDDWNRNNILNKTYPHFEAFAQEEHVGTHYEAAELVKLLENIGFTIENAGTTFGYFGKLAWELEQLTRNTRWKAILLPLMKLLCSIDVYTARKGTGVYALAKK